MTATDNDGDASERSNPYVGLRPFFFEDSLYFFGRDRQINDLLILLRHNRFLGVVGSSGSGKSSLVRAGLLPMLLGGFLESERDQWAMAQVKPGDTPLINLAEGLFRATGETVTPDAITALVDDIRERHTQAVIEFLGTRVATSNILVLVDQFEEVFAFRSKLGDPGPQQAKERAQRRSEATAYVDLMLRLAEYPDLPIYVVLTMRTDFLGDCDLFYGLPEALNIGRYLVPRLSRDELREGVECPASLVSATVAPRLLDQVLNALGDRVDRLPLLQHTLVRTFDEWVRCGRKGPIDLEHYDAVGGLERALNNEADAAMAGLEPWLVEAVFRRLTNTDINQRRVRSPARISELMAVAGVGRDSIDAIIAPFADKRRSFLYVSNDGRPDDPRVDIAHESLIRNWDRLVGWTDTENQVRETFIGLVGRARRWRAGTGSLLEGPERRTAIAWATATNPKPGWALRYALADDDYDAVFAYLNASQKSLYRWRGLTIALPVVVLLSVSVLFGYSETEKYNARNEAIDESIRLVEAMTTNMYSVLEAMPSSADARRELLLRSRDFSDTLTNYNNDTASADFWNLILEGDTYIDTLADSDDLDAVTDAKFSQAFDNAKSKYEAAVDLARTRTGQYPDIIAWKVELAIGLGKLASVSPDAPTICNRQRQVVSLDDAIRAHNDASYDWRYQSFNDYNELARNITDCLKPNQRLHYFTKSRAIAIDLARDKSISLTRLGALAGGLQRNGLSLGKFEDSGPLATVQETIPAAVQMATAVQFFERIYKAKPTKQSLGDLALAQADLGLIYRHINDLGAAATMFEKAATNRTTLIGLDPENADYYKAKLADIRAEQAAIKRR